MPIWAARPAGICCGRGSAHDAGARIGRAAAEEARGIAAPAGAALPDDGASANRGVSVEEEPGGIRPNSLGTIRSGRRALPVLGRYNVVVVGGGTSGDPAGIAAAKRGAKTLVIEYLFELGGVGTTGLIASYWYGLRGGYTGYVDRQVNPGKSTWSAREKAEWLRRELGRQHADVRLGAARLRDAGARSPGMRCGRWCDAGRLAEPRLRRGHGCRRGRPSRRTHPGDRTSEPCRSG